MSANGPFRISPNSWRSRASSLNMRRRWADPLWREYMSLVRRAPGSLSPHEQRRLQTLKNRNKEKSTRQLNAEIFAILRKDHPAFEHLSDAAFTDLLNVLFNRLHKNGGTKALYQELTGDNLYSRMTKQMQAVLTQRGKMTVAIAETFLDRLIASPQFPDLYDTLMEEPDADHP